MLSKNDLTPRAISRYLPQFFIGLFFLTAAYLKWAQALFGPHRIALDAIFLHWMRNGMPLEWYKDFMTWSLPYTDWLAAIVILLQGLAGLLLILNWRVRLAGLCMFIVQLNVYLATYHQLELRVLGSQAMLMSIFFFARSEMRGRVWALMTYAMVLIGLVHLYGRYMYFSDASMEAALWQRGYFALYNMSSWPGLKSFVLWATAGTAGMLLWAGMFWIKLGLLFGMLTRYRLQAGAALLVIVLSATLIWLNTWSCEGVFWVLLLFLWVVHERELQRAAAPKSLLP